MKDEHEHKHDLSEIGHDESENKGDHYHNIHHIYGDNQEDDVKSTDFSPIHFFKKRQTKNSVFYISATGIFLALSIVASVIDIGLELIDMAIPPINGIPVVMRFLDILVVMLAVTSIGPHFASIIAIVTPFLHAVIHGEIWNPYEPLFDAISYLLIVWLLWICYYVLFRNSMFHRHPNEKVDRFRRWMPVLPFVLIGPLIFTAFYILTIYISTIQGKTGEDGQSFHEFSKMALINFVIVYFANVLRCAFDIVIFCLIEPKMKIINHRYY
jgi:hypothetical protein